MIFYSYVQYKIYCLKISEVNFPILYMLYWISYFQDKKKNDLNYFAQWQFCHSNNENWFLFVYSFMLCTYEYTHVWSTLFIQRLCDSFPNNTYNEENKWNVEIRHASVPKLINLYTLYIILFLIEYNTWYIIINDYQNQINSTATRSTEYRMVTIICIVPATFWSWLLTTS